MLARYLSTSQDEPRWEMFATYLNGTQTGFSVAFGCVYRNIRSRVNNT